MAEVDEHDTEELLSVPDQTDANFRWTVKKYRFVYHMARLGNATEAAKRSGYATADYGAVLMAQLPVRMAVQYEVRTILNAEHENEETVISRWHQWANVNIKEFFDEGWELKDITSLPDELTRCIKKVTVRQTQHGRDVNFEIQDAARANTDLANFMGMLSKDGETAPPEETAKSIKQMLDEMKEVDAQEPSMEIGRAHV